MAKGYGTAGASKTKRATKGFKAQSGSTREDIDFNNYTLRQRGRLMYMGAPIGASAIKTHRTNTIGTGLVLNPHPDAEYLGLTDEQAAAWVRDVKREFNVWAKRGRACDATGLNNFYELQQLMIVSWLSSGDVFALIQRRNPTLNEPYSLRIKVIEADRCATKGISSLPSGGRTGRNEKNGNKIYDGVEIDKYGMPVAYWFRNTHPGEATGEATTWSRVEAVGEKTGLPNVLHLMNAERPDQYRGVTYLAQAIESVLQINRYTEGEIMAAVIQSFFTAFVTTTDRADEMPFNEVGESEYDEQASYDPNDYEMGPGQINVMNPGESVDFGSPTHPQTGFDTFVKAIATQIGAALEIPREILLKEFTASYSASRGALLEAWKSFKMYRTWFINDICDPIYEIWLTEAIALGRISAPGFFNDRTIKNAWLGAEWIGPSQGQLDPKKEVEAEILACQFGFSTYSDSARRLNGSDFESNISRLRTEIEELKSVQPDELYTPEEDDDEEEEPV